MEKLKDSETLKEKRLGEIKLLGKEELVDAYMDLFEISIQKTKLIAIMEDEKK